MNAKLFLSDLKAQGVAYESTNFRRRYRTYKFKDPTRVGVSWELTLSNDTQRFECGRRWERNLDAEGNCSLGKGITTFEEFLKQYYPNSSI